MLASAEEQNTAAWKIFNRHFFVKVQNQFLYSDNFLRHKGIVSHSPEEAMREMLSMRLTCLTIAELVELRNMGALIEFTEVKDSQIVYDIIVEHLRNWAEIVNNVIYDYVPPAEDLYLLDEMAAELHPFIARTKVRELNQGIDTRRIGRAFLGKSIPKEQFTLEDVNRYKNIAPAIINRASAYYGAKEFDTQERDRESESGKAVQYQQYMERDYTHTHW